MNYKHFVSVKLDHTIGSVKVGYGVRSGRSVGVGYGVGVGHNV